MDNYLLEAMTKYADGNRARHIANVKVYLNNSAGIGEHSDIIEAMEQEMQSIAKYDDILSVIEKHFK